MGGGYYTTFKTINEVEELDAGYEGFIVIIIIGNVNDNESKINSILIFFFISHDI